MPTVNKWSAIQRVELQPRYSRFFLVVIQMKQPNLWMINWNNTAACSQEHKQPQIGLLFTLRTFRLTGTMSSKLLSSKSGSYSSIDTDDIGLLASLLKSWFNRA